MKFTAFISLVVLLAMFQVAKCNMFFGGFFGSSSDSSSGEEDCRCSSGRRNPCASNSSTYQLGCPGTNQYLQCANTSCSNGTCPSGQVWSSTAKTCAACDTTSYHVNAAGQRCVCNEGTTLNYTSKSCVRCPAQATIEPDQCFCPNTTVFDPLTYACRACPASSIQTRLGCQCVNQTYWNAVAWACQPCPGTMTTQQSGRRTYQVCQCPGTNAIFYAPKVVCYTCPSGVTSDSDGDRCTCPIRGQVFNYDNGACQCPPGTQLNAAGTSCTRIPRTTTVAAAAPA